MSLRRHLDFWAGVPVSALLSCFSSRPAELPSQPQKILIIKLAAAGDTILLLPVLKAFRQAHPSAQVHWLVSNVNAVLARESKDVDKILVWGGGLARLPALISVLRSEKYEMVLDLEQWSRGTGLVAYLSGAPFRVGYDTPGQHRARLFTHTIPKRFDRHEIEEFYELLSQPKKLAVNKTLALPVPPAGREELKEKALFLEKKPVKSPLVLIHPGCGSDGTPREWPVEQYAVLGHWLIKKYGATLVLSSGPEERAKTDHLRRLLHGEAQDLGGRLSWPGMIALADAADLVISGNTGVMHIAAALQKKQIALHGPTDPKIWGPINLHARVIQSDCPQCPCLKLGFEYHATDSSCMKRIQVETVKEAVAGLIDNHRAI